MPDFQNLASRRLASKFTDAEPERRAVLELYQAEDCPYSETVRRRMQELGLSFVAHNPRTHDGDVRDEAAHEELLERGGEDQIPFLVDPDRGESLYDSDDIVAYLDEHYG